ncbi:MAG: asparagine synthase (glutamine-hydrolyzing) [Nitrospiraceae bacterium]|nr:asparagine synthase (glutamine-hydrolyzing) [Nitrospiraceae bacterium]
MCGICGIYNYKSGETVTPSLLRDMCKTIAHRGPDEEGIWTNGNIGLGHRRLSIIDLSSGQQPMSNEDGSIWIAFNGEIYNYRDLNPFLEERGHVFRTRCDTETIIHLYEEKGDDFLKDLGGMFAFSLWDGRKKRLIIARDRLGKKPLYYSDRNGSLIFASELKALFAAAPIPKDIDFTALSDYLSLLYVPAPKTIFMGVKKLEPGTCLIADRNGCRTERYWDLSCQPRFHGSFESATEELKENIKRCVESRLESEVPLGAFLSGGVDSSAVVYSMSQLLKKSVNTTSIGFRETGFNELPYARTMADRVKSEHHEYMLEPDFIRNLPRIIWHLDEPFADSSVMPTYLLCEMTRKNVTVALSGDGGDENFAGYTRYSSAHNENLFRFAPAWMRAALLKPIGRLLPSTLRGYNFLRNVTATREQAMANTFFHFEEPLKKELFSTFVKKELQDYETFSIIGRYFSECDSDDPITRLQYVDVRTYLPEDILMKVDKMSMAHSLEVRAPFLDHKLVEFAFSLPSNFKLNGGCGKYILKQAFNGALPDDLLYRKKAGFSVPIDFWFRDKLKGLMQSVLFDARTVSRGYFDPACVRRLWQQYQRHPFYQIDLSSHLWALFVFELWNRIFIDGEMDTVLQ